MERVKPYYQEPKHTIYCGHALDILKQMSVESVDCVVTSPPYWGLRTYKTEPIIWGENHFTSMPVYTCQHEWGDLIPNPMVKSGKHGPASIVAIGTKIAEHAVRKESNQGSFCLKCNAWRGELGLEPTIELYIQHLILIFNEVKRVLKKTGTCWVNIDDSYASGTRKTNKPQTIAGGNEQDLPLEYSPSRNMPDYPAKSLCLIPQRFALAMVENGWILRNDIVWNKPNPMPESVKDRFTGSWEHLYFFAKSKKYWFEQQFEPITYEERWGNHNKIYNESERDGLDAPSQNPLGRNKRDVWEINTQANPFDLCLSCGGVFEHAFGKPCPVCHETNWSAHFATFPEKLCETPILAGCPSMICKKCGKTREKVYKPTLTAHDGKTESSYEIGTAANRLALLRQAARERGEEYQNDMECIGCTDCGCNAAFETGVVLDPFTGSGTAQAVAKRLGRKSIGIELNPNYCKLAARRLQEIPMAMELES